MSSIGRVLHLTAKIRDVSISPIARGGSSEVYSANLVGDDARSTRVVIKVLRGFMVNRSDVREKQQRKFDQEVEILRRVDHPNIAEFLGIATVDSRPSVVLLWYPNGDASTYTGSLGPNARTERIQLVMGVVSAIKYLHNENPPLAHGDIKGANILVDSAGEAVLSGFGHAVAIGGLTINAPGTTSVLGSYRWLAPELVVGSESSSDTMPTLESDIWALGCTLCELFTDDIPYHFRREFWSVRRDIIKGVYPYQEEIAARCGSREIWDITKRCWTLTPQDRPRATDIENRLLLASSL